MPNVVRMPVTTHFLLSCYFLLSWVCFYMTYHIRTHVPSLHTQVHTHSLLTHMLICHAHFSPVHAPFLQYTQVYTHKHVFPNAKHFVVLLQPGWHAWSMLVLAAKVER